MIFTNNKKVQILLGSLVLYAITTGVSYVVFNTLEKSISITTPFGSLTDVTSGTEEGVRDQPCPLDGAFYTKSRREQWQARRPLAVMVENHVDAKPIIGLSRADVVYEAVAEGGITRFMAIFLCQDAGDIAPVRSARTYFLNWLSEYDASYAHVGGANTPGPANALGQIEEYGIYDLDQFGIGFPTYWRGTDKLAPHNVHSTTKKLWEAAEKRNFGPKNEEGEPWDKNFKEWKFKDDALLEARGSLGSIVVPFWSQQPDYTVTWQYDKEANLYKRYETNTAQIDSLTNEHISAKSVIIQFQVESEANDGYPDGHLLYKTTGTGKALIFLDGKVASGTWQKSNRSSRTIFFDSQGREVSLNRGRVWIQTVPVGNNVTY